MVYIDVRKRRGFTDRYSSVLGETFYVVFCECIILCFTLFYGEFLDTWKRRLFEFILEINALAEYDKFIM